MKKKNLFYCIIVVMVLGAGLLNVEAQEISDGNVWKGYNVGTILFEDKAPATQGSDIYRRIIPDPKSYITEQAYTVLSTLYDSPEDSIPPVHNIHYTLEDIDGVSAKGGSHGNISIFYSTRHIERNERSLIA